jgi:hypothetical protein
MTRSITEWVKILEGKTPQEAAHTILIRRFGDGTLAFPDTTETKELAQALTAWAMLAITKATASS